MCAGIQGMALVFRDPVADDLGLAFLANRLEPWYLGYIAGIALETGICVCVCVKPCLPREFASMHVSLFLSFSRRGPRARHTAWANEALYDVARKTYLQISSWVL